jgi:hypothetical protein
MNLRFTHHVLVLALSIGASARIVNKANVGFTLADHSPLFQEHANEKVIPRRRAKRITASILGQEAATRRNFYNPDVGILQGKTLLRRFGSVPKNEKEHRRDASEIGAEYLTRFLESSSRDKYRQEHPRCGTNGTCYPGFCDAYESGEDYEDLAVAQNAICNGVTDANGKKWEFEGCIRDYPGYPDYQLYTKSNYCGISKCLVDGGLYGACICQAYKSLCEMFGDVRKIACSLAY